MTPKTYNRLFLVLWAAVAANALAVILSWINIRAVNPLTYIMGTIYMLVPAGLVAILQKHYGQDTQ